MAKKYKTALYQTKHEQMSVKVTILEDRVMFGRQEYLITDKKPMTAPIWVTKDKLTDISA